MHFSTFTVAVALSAMSFTIAHPASSSSNELYARNPTEEGLSDTLGLDRRMAAPVGGTSAHEHEREHEHEPTHEKEATAKKTAAPLDRRMPSPEPGAGDVAVEAATLSKKVIDETRRQGESKAHNEAVQKAKNEVAAKEKAKKEAQAAEKAKHQPFEATRLNQEMAIGAKKMENRLSGLRD